MTRQPKIADSPAKYGSKGQSWATGFVRYMTFVVSHKNYAKMPDAIKEDGMIQWEAPSNRSAGLYQFTHNKRKDWWKEKAKSIGIDTTQDQWISRTAKRIHPTGKKPCKRCGKVMEIAYVYPGARLIRRFEKHFDAGFETSLTRPIYDVLRDAADKDKGILFESIGAILATKNIVVPDFDADIEKLISWIEKEYVPLEPPLLSPGAMSNAPDRFDGFHSFNRCCRSKADTGRHADNLRNYTTDRRVFEYWSDGDWIAADRLMGLVKTSLNEEKCADGGKGPPTADHIGPLSLGFCHRPEFRLLSQAANSAKNNRMTLQDVRDLILREKSGFHVASWHTKPLWDLRKHSVKKEEQALRLSKMLRDNQRNAMQILCKLNDEGVFAFLINLLELSYANNKIEFKNLHAENFLTTYDDIICVPRETKYTEEQKARRIRIGFEALKTYRDRKNRHMMIFCKDSTDEYLSQALCLLRESDPSIPKFDREIGECLFPESGVASEEDIRELAKNFPSRKSDIFEDAKNILVLAMTSIGISISDMWEHERYMRDDFDM